MSRAYYNEYDPFAAEWLRMLIACGHIADGDVDTRSIEDVRPNDLAGYTQVHLFAGIGGWSRAFRLAGVPDSAPYWSCSCPCQPFSAAGKGDGFADERHLWPSAFHLITQREPERIFGEQVAAKAALAWLDLVYSDLEATGYTVGTSDLCAASVGAAHIRQRLYWTADSVSSRRQPISDEPGSNATRVESGRERLQFSEHRGNTLIRADSQHSERRPELQEHGDAYGRDGLGGMRDVGERSDSSGQGLEEQQQQRRISTEAMESSEREAFISRGHTRGFWSPADWWYGRDGKYRPIEPGIFPLAHGVSKRMGRLRGYGNAIVPQVAAEFIKAAL